MRGAGTLVELLAKEDDVDRSSAKVTGPRLEMHPLVQDDATTKEEVRRRQEGRVVRYEMSRETGEGGQRTLRTVNTVWTCRWGSSGARDKHESRLR